MSKRHWNKRELEVIEEYKQKVRDAIEKCRGYGYTGYNELIRILGL